MLREEMGFINAEGELYKDHKNYQERKVETKNNDLMLFSVYIFHMLSIYNH